MIVPMEKLSLLIFHKDYQAFLGELREKGVVHIHENKKKSAEDEQLKQKLVLIKRIGEMIRLLGKRQQETEGEMPEEKGAELLQSLENSYKRQEQIDQQLLSLKKDGALYEPWGTFSKERIEELGKAGWDMRFFTVPDRKYMPEWEEKYNAFVISQEKGQKYFVTFTPKETDERPEADAVVFPQLTAEEIRQKTEELNAEKEQLGHYLNQIAGQAITALQDYRLQVYEDTDELKIEDATQKLLDDKVIAIEGWVPEKTRPDMEKWLSDKGVYYGFEKPELTDNPPILLKNNKFARLFEFIGELYSLPNYREIDLTPFFAPFFVLFFGFCLGDAGYGLLLLIGISIYKIKAKPALRPILSLAQWLGAATVIMGIVSGTFFGIQLLEVQVPWVVKFRSLMLDSQQLFNLALIIGGVQIIFGMFLKVANQWKQYGFPAALSTIGWLILILGEGACYLFSMKGYDTRMAMYVVGGVAGVFIFLLNNLKRNVFINIGAGLWDSYNTVTGLLGDTLSYIRLFALGISSAVLGLVFNDLAVNMSGDIPVIKQLVMLIILVFGHSVNLFMAGLGSFVHPMRLTFVEFYKNAGFEGGGKKYQPFRRRKSEA
ncbi:MAG: hypothetical protein NC410_06445 [Oscillibacter sp.]|nr:hypothetical protein [Oscillibacter sp.]